MPSSINRHLLGDIGIRLDDSQYIQTIAGMGASQTSSQLNTGSDHLSRSLTWNPRKFLALYNSLTVPRQIDSHLASYRTTWLSLLESSNKRVFLIESDFKTNTPDLVDITKILNTEAAASESVAIEKRAPQADLRWQWPIRISAFPSDFDSLHLSNLRNEWPSRSLTEIQVLDRANARCEILILPNSVREALRRILEFPYGVRACHIIFIGPMDVEWHSIRSQLDALLAETQAGAISLISPSSLEKVPALLNHWVERLSHNESYDLTLARAFPRDSALHMIDLRMIDRTALPNIARSLGQRLKTLPTSAKFNLPTSTTNRINSNWNASLGPSALGMDLQSRAGELPFHHESEAGTGLSEIAMAEREARRNAAFQVPARFLQGDLYSYYKNRQTQERRGLVVGKRYQLEVFIAPEGTGAIQSDQAFSDDALDWSNNDSFTLQVLFAEPTQWEAPLSGSLSLPRQGSSSKCSFIFSPTVPGAFSGRITVYYRGRVLQTALLRTTVVGDETVLETPLGDGPLQFIVEAEIRRSLSTLDDRRRFDACLVLNKTTEGTPTAQVAGNTGAYITSIDVIGPQLAEINSLLNDVALNEKRYKKGLQSKENAKLLCDLAASGFWIHNQLISPYLNSSSSAKSLRSSRYLQIVSMKPDAVIPLEFVYDYLQPRPDAPVCENAIQALKEGDCPSTCKPTKSPASHVCPLGFWGLSKVIERHAIDPQLTKPAFLKSEPIAGRTELMLKGSSLLATSKEVSASDRQDLKNSMKSLSKGDVAAVKSWDAWRDAIAKKKPVVLLALPHTAGQGSHISLEISGETIESMYIDESYVRADPNLRPIVFLLGCDTVGAAPTDVYARHIAVFRQAQAALVLGTVATVLGSDAAKVAQQLIKHLEDTGKKSGERFGEVLLQTKRRAVAESLMIAMCLVAFGDADWQLK